MKESSIPSRLVAAGVETAWEAVSASFERFCLTAGIATLTEMMQQDAVELCGARHARSSDRRGYRWGRTAGKLGFHGGKVAIERPRVRARGDDAELSLPSWEAAQAEDWLGRWAMNLMLINVSTRRFGRAVRLPEGDIAAAPGTGVSKSAVSRRFVALSAERMGEWMAADLSGFDLLAIQIDGMHVTGELTLLAAVGIDGEGVKHPLGLLEGATENAAVVQALLDNLIERGLDPKICRLFIIDGSKALTKAIRRTLRPQYPDPALPGSQGTQHRRTAAQALARLGACDVAPGMGTGRCGEGRAADPQSGTSPGTSGTGCRRQYSRRHRRDADGESAWPAAVTAPLAGLHQHHREHDGHHSACLPQRQTLA